MQNDYYIYAVILKNCPYSSAAYELLNSFKNIKKEFTFIRREEMDSYRTEDISTFPQIYLKRENSKGNKLIGGYDDLKRIKDTFYNKMNEKDLKSYLSNNNSWNKKTLLRLIELINS
jgi:glutaredoxin